MMTRAEYNHKQLKNTTMGLNVLSLMCFFISAAFTIMLMWDGAATPLKQCLNVIMACCLEIAKVYFFRFLGGEIASKDHENLPGKVALWLLTVFLFIASTFGSIHYYMKTSAEKNLDNRGHDAAYTAMNSDISAYDTQIAQLLELARNQQAKHYITASKETLAKVDALRKQKSQAMKDVSGYKGTDTSDEFYALVSKFFGCQPEAAKGGMYLFLSILLEFCGIASAFYGAFSKRKLMDIELAGMPEGNYKPDYGIRSADGNFYINPRGVAAPAFNPAPAFAEREPEPPKPERKAGFVPPTGSVSDDIAASIEKIKADLKQKSATGSGTGTGYSNKTAKTDAAIKFESPVTSTSTGIPVPEPEPVTGMKLKSKPPVTVPDESEDGDMDIDKITLDYIRELFAGQKPDGSLTGRAQVSKKLDISDDIARVIHVRLKKAGHIRVEGSKTFPECGKDEMLSAVSGGAV